jgi:cytochrome P450
MSPFLNRRLMGRGAGSDTTAISLRAMLYYMLKNPSTMRKLQKEIEEMEEKGLISDPITYQQSCKMPYLQAIMKEAMRYHLWSYCN